MGRNCDGAVDVGWVWLRWVSSPLHSTYSKVLYPLRYITLHYIAKSNRSMWITFYLDTYIHVWIVDQINELMQPPNTLVVFRSIL